MPAPSLAEVPVAAPTMTSAPVAQVPSVTWSKSSAKALIEVIEASADEGLDPADYGADRLRDAMERGQIDPVAFNAAAMKLASDYRYGRVPRNERVDWFSEPANPILLATLVANGINDDKVEKTFDKLLPQTEDYKSLKRALAETPASDTAKRTALMVNLERWRWMPREMGNKHIFVNIPSYRVELVEDGAVVAEHAAIVGKPASPTPQFSTEVKAVRFNPGWAVPPGLKKQKLAMYQRNPAAARRAGYSVKQGPDGPAIFQAPGPGNALGQVRLVMPNPYMIYLHDTPEKKLFGKEARALSQGCVRTDRPVEFAERLLTEDGTSSSEIDAALAKRNTTRELSLNKSVPVHIAYFTAEADEGGSVKMLSDPYGRDARVARALGGSVALASK
ncbi:L,D-transpeptidase family protein [Sphingoaurantiacus capsulatus]|uniref:L,D-transpeptidase family protein n=1 Tax=Sphingoaurantiacus capsulatus TaxID=1771310 RepID=A0ABV7X5V0_9SPHN